MIIVWFCVPVAKLRLSCKMKIEYKWVSKVALDIAYLRDLGLIFGGIFMINIYTFKGKVLILSFACLAMSYALTDSIYLFAMVKKDEVQASINDPIPVVVLSDGENKKIMEATEFFRSASSNPNLSADDIAKVVRLKNEIELGKAQIELLKKLTEKPEKKEENSLIGDLKEGPNNFWKAIKYLAHGPVALVSTAIMVGGVSLVVLWFYGRTDILYAPFVLVKYILSWVPDVMHHSPLAKPGQTDGCLGFGYDRNKYDFKDRVCGPRGTHPNCCPK